MHNDTFLRACLRLPTPYTPVWLMRQAGRYLPEYRALRAQAGSFMALATNPELACEVTLQPLARYDLDAAILFSDILTVPDAMGLGLEFTAGEGPRFAHPVVDEAAVARLTVPDMSRLRYVFDAVRTIRRSLQDKLPLIGFCGSPWTLACYMVEGGSSTDFQRIKTMLYQRPDLLHRILGINADACAAYLNEQIAAGAQAVMIFDSWGGTLSHHAFGPFSLDYTQRVLEQLQIPPGKPVPRIVFTKGGSPWLKSMAQLPCDVLGLDWTVNMADAKKVVGPHMAVQGNLDPAVLLGSPEHIQTEVAQALSGMGDGHIFNLGHGIVQQTPPDNVQVLVQAVHEQSARTG